MVRMNPYANQHILMDIQILRRLLDALFGNAINVLSMTLPPDSTSIVAESGLRCRESQAEQRASESTDGHSMIPYLLSWQKQDVAGLHGLGLLLATACCGMERTTTYAQTNSQVSTHRANG